MKKFIPVLMAFLFAIAFSCAFTLSTAQEAFAAEGTNVDHHSQQEIINYLSESGVSLFDATEYSVTPVKYTVRGELSDKSKNGALAILNNIRYIAGLNPVSLDDSYGDLAQAAAFVNASIGQLTHYPSSVTTKPETMSEEDWNLGNEGARQVNLASGLSTLNLSVRDWTYDEDSGNVSVIGHRRWCLNPKMGKTGFGATGPYYAMYSFDTSGSGAQNNVAWPAENMPVEYFNKNIPWSLSTGTTVSVSNVTVTLTRINDGKVWTFSSSETYQTSNQKYFNVDNQGYGQRGCIIFRPDEIDGYNDGDQFNVRITGVGSTPIEYTVKFFNAVPLKGIKFSPEEDEVKVGGWKWPNVYPLPRESSEELNRSEITYESSDESVATVGSSGSIDAVGVGKATITATYHGMTAQYVLTVKKSIFDSVKNSYTLENPVYTGSAVVPTVELRDGNKVLEEGTDYYVVVEDETIECDGQTHRYICYGQGEYISGIAFNYSVQPKQLTADMFSLSPQTYVYDGQHHTPDVSGTYNNMTMVEGTDYSVVEDEDTISAGMHHLTINGSGNYKGNCQIEYPIQAKDIAEAEIIIGQDTLVYNGEEQIPDVVVKDGGKTFEKDKDYTLTTDEATSAGKHTIIIKGVNNYQGSVSPTYTIAKAEKPFVMPSSEYSVPYSTKALTDDILSDAPGWGFDSADLGKDLTPGETAEYTAHYEGEDAGNFDNLDAVVKVTRTECNHPASSMKQHKAIANACEKDGNTEYWECEICGLFFSDKEAQNVIEEGSWVISATGHKWDEPTYEWSDDYGTVTASRVCQNDPTHTESETSATTSETTKEANCSQTGLIHYTSNAFKNPAFAVQEKDREIPIDLTAHDWDAPTYVWSKDNSSVTATRVCKRDDTHKQTEEAVTQHEEAKPATCTEKGVIHYISAAFENDAFAVQEKDVETYMLPHAWDNGTVTTKPTCMTEGEMTYHCTACDASYTKPIDIDPEAHQWDEGIVITQPKCDNAGVRLRTCKLCEKTKEEAIDKTPHTPGETVIENEVNPTCTEDGSFDEVVYCAVCDAELSRETKPVPTEGHTMEHTPAVAATCTEAGNSEYWYCTKCEKFFADENGEQQVAENSWVIAALGHKWDAGKITTAPTATKTGVKTFTCTVCDVTKEVTLPARNNQVAADGTKVGPGASAEVANKAITGMKTDSDPAGSAFGLLKAKSTKQAKASVTITWSKVKGAKKYVIYGNACGKSNKMKKLATVTGSSYTAKKIINNKGKKVKVKKGTYYKFIIVALNGNRDVVSTSKVIHIATKGGKVGNDKSVTTKAKKNKVTVKVGKTFSLKAKAIPVSKKLKVKRHRVIAYESSNKAIATVSSKGVIKGKKKGTCYVYAYAQDGICKKITVTVK